MLEIKLVTSKPMSDNETYKTKVKELLDKVKDILKNQAEENCIEAVEHIDMALKSLGFSGDMETEKEPEMEDEDDVEGMKKTKGNFMDMMDEGDHEYR